MLAYSCVLIVINYLKYKTIKLFDFMLLYIN